MVFEAARVGQNCEFCGSPALVDYNEIKAPIRPQGVLPFKVDASRVRDDIRRWWRSKWFAPGRLARAALVDTVRSLYIPYWTFDAQVHCPWDGRGRLSLLRDGASRDAKGGRVMRQERRTRWEPASGVVDHVLRRRAGARHAGAAARPAAAGRAVSDAGDRALRHGVPLRPRRRALQVVLLEAAQRSQEQMHAKLEQLCAQQVPGDTHRNLRDHPDYSRPHVQARARAGLAAVVQLRRQGVQVIVNGYTGTIAGDYPYSAWKIFFAVLAATIAAVILIVISNQ